MNQFTDWMQQWQQQASQAAPFFNPFAHAQQQAPQMNFMSMMQSPFQNWQNQQQQMFTNFVPHNDILAFWESISRYNLNNSSLQDVLMNPYLTEFQKAYEQQDLEAQKQAIRELCHHWFERSNFMLNKHLDVLIWQKDMLKLGHEQVRWDMVQSDYQQDARAYCLALITSYEELINLIRIFDGFEGEVTDRFLDKVLSMDVEIKDVEQLFAMWCDLFDVYYKECTFSTGYRTHFAAFVSAISKCRSTQQTIVDKSVELFGLPSKREMDAVHKRVQQQQKALRSLDTGATATAPANTQAIESLQTALQTQQATLDALQSSVAETKQLAKEMTKLQSELAKKDIAINKLSAALVSTEKRLKTLITATPSSSAAAASTAKANKKKAADA